jgi:glycosyltransferase involved in cell wall biosynthesis
VLRVSLVTPSLNQARFLDDAISSVFDQGYPELEYVVADGGSQDGSREVLERHAERLSAWWSEPDGGPADAVARGFAGTTGEIMGWLNADDRLLPGALWVVAELFERFPDVDWITSGFPAWLDEDGRLVLLGRADGFARDAFLRGLHGDLVPWSRLYFPQQESTFWRRRLWDAAGARLDPSVEPAADFELWCRFFEHAELYTVDTALGAFRAHAAQRTATQMGAYRARAAEVLARHGNGSAGLLERARGVASRRLPARLPVGWDAPYLRWERRTGTWTRGRRRYA